MVCIHLSHRLTMRCVALVLVCLLFHILLTDCGPIRKKRVKSKNASTTVNHGMRDSPLNQSSNVIESVNADHLQGIKGSKDVVHFDQVNFAGKRVAPDRVNDAGIEEIAAGNGPVPDVPAHHQSVDDGEKVGQLPPVPSIPGSSKVNTTLEGQQLKVVDDGDDVKKPREEQGVAVGVGGVNREISTTTTPPPQLFHGGQDDSLYVGAADRGDSSENRPKAQSHNGASDNEPSDTIKIKGDDGFPDNPALQQPPPQQREPPDQFQDKKIQLGPVKPDRDAPVGQQQAPMGRDEIQLKEEPAAAEAAYDEHQPKEDAVKFNQQKNVAVNDQHDKQSEKLNDINPPDHMEGFRLERDGHLNRDYKKEIFLGHHEEFEWSDEEKVSGKLKVIFRR